MRFLLFVAAFVIAAALTAPLDRWFLDYAREPLAAAGVDLRLGGLNFALPFGVRATGIGVDRRDNGIDIDSLYVGITRAFEADACGGQIHGQAFGDSISLELSGVDPSRCLRVGKLALECSLDGKLRVDGIDVKTLAAPASARARIDLASDGGMFRGILSNAGRNGEDVPLGEWEFTELALHATLADGHLDVEEGRALTSGVEWQLVGATLPTGDSRGGLRVDFRARQVDDGPRSRALIGLMPKASPDGNGWRNYRVTGSVASPRVVAVD